MTDTVIFFILRFFYFILLSVFITGAYAAIKGAPWVPTKKKDIKRALRLLEIKKGEKFYDLGCGDGRLVFAIAKKGATAKGLEIGILPYIIAVSGRIFQKEKEKISISYCNLWKTDLQDADAVYLFLMPRFYPKIKEKLRKELKKGARVAVYSWPIKEWKPAVVDKKEGEIGMYLYIIGKDTLNK